MVSNFIHTRLTRTSSDLRMLSATLLPPSPLLKADDLLTLSTSGEIPILLEAMTRACDSPLSAFGEPPGLCDVAKERNLTDRLETTLENTRSLTRGGETMIENCEESEDVHNASESPDRCFGVEPPSKRSPVKVVSSKPKNVIHPTYGGSDVLGNDAGDSGSWTPISVRQVNFGIIESPRSFRPSTLELSTTPVTPKEDLGGDQLMIATFHTYATLPTPTFAPPSPSSSVDVVSPLFSPVGRQRHRRPLERARAVRFPGRPRSPRLQVNEVETNLVHDAPASSTKHNSASPMSTHSGPEMAGIRGFDAAHPSVKHVALPEELSWIKHMTIALWIDQEGFRAVRSGMQLMGYSPRTRSLHPYESAENAESGSTAGVAEFMPMKRETFTFHYATLDSPPTLRMVSVTGDESRDYISRQAALSVKANGVYTVLGTETFIASTLNNDVHGSRLYWKFDYFVSDRKVDGTGKALHGEKTLTPLTFSCSPYLFHPLQGKKAGLMHIMKKSLVPKLGSHRLEPPPSHSISRTAHYSLTRDAATHTRSHSEALAKSGHYHSLSTRRSPLDTGAGGGVTLGMNHMPRVRRRRASSAGENSLTLAGNEPGQGHGGGVALTRRGMLMPGATLFR